MQQDMHYYAVGFLARAAGIPKADANIIAYASQYVDDSTESVAIHTKDDPFLTVRTAHLGLEAWTEEVQKDIYVPFHFLPELPTETHKATCVTEPDSKFAASVLERALREDHRLDQLVAVGIAMHTYADTFSHQGFSGGEDDDNQIQNVEHRILNEWESHSVAPLIDGFIRGVGHLLAGDSPDYPWLSWRWTQSVSGVNMTRDNFSIFLDASRAMYDRFRGMPFATERVLPWGEIEPTIRQILSRALPNLDNRVPLWLEAYGDRFRDSHGHRNIRGYRYVPTTWMDEAVEIVGNLTTPWDGLRRKDLVGLRHKYKPKPGFLTSKWARFHRMATKQRDFVKQADILNQHPN